MTLTRKGQAHPLCKGLPDTFTAFHWHGETFSIPPKAQAIASSEACAHQAFTLGSRMVGLQFHLETTPESMELLIDNCADELAPLTNHVQTPEVMRSTFDQPSDMDFLLKTLLNNLTKEIMK